MQREYRFRVEAGAHHRENCPITAALTIPIPKAGASLVDKSGKQRMPVQVARAKDGWEVSWLVDRLRAGGSREYLFRVGEGEEFLGMEVEDKEGVVDICSDDRLISSYRYGRDASKPYLHPVNGPGGVSVTEDEPGDHVHHRSFWVAHGDVNGTDLWSEERDSGRIVHKAFERLVSGPVYGEVVAANTWQKSSGEALLDEERRIRFWNIPGDEWLIDLDVTLKTSYGDVLFGDTKEGGMASIRVAQSMTVLRGGRIENSFGGINEEETWGRRAFWCDYSGPINGERLGIALFDHYLNPRHPTHWHVRNYGLMTANIFGLSYFEKAKPGSGNLLIKAGNRITFRYRMYVHREDAVSANVKEKYLDYRYPPKVSLLT